MVQRRLLGANTRKTPLNGGRDFTMFRTVERYSMCGVGAMALRLLIVARGFDVYPLSDSTPKPCAL